MFEVELDPPLVLIFLGRFEDSFAELLLDGLGMLLGVASEPGSSFDTSTECSFATVYEDEAERLLGVEAVSTASRVSRTVDPGSRNIRMFLKPGS